MGMSLYIIQSQRQVQQHEQYHDKLSHIHAEVKDKSMVKSEVQFRVEHYAVLPRATSTTLGEDIVLNVASKDRGRNIRKRIIVRNKPQEGSNRKKSNKKGLRSSGISTANFSAWLDLIITPVDIGHDFI
jgi:hypothetical protein